MHVLYTMCVSYCCLPLSSLSPPPLLPLSPPSPLPPSPPSLLPHSEIQELLHVSFGRTQIEDDLHSSSPLKHGYDAIPVCYLLVVR